MDPAQSEQQRLNNITQELADLPYQRDQELSTLSTNFNEMRTAAHREFDSKMSAIDTNERAGRDAATKRYATEEQRLRGELSQTQHEIERIRARDQERQRANTGGGNSFLGL